MCADWEKGPVDLSIAERKIPSGGPKRKDRADQNEKTCLGKSFHFSIIINRYADTDYIQVYPPSTARFTPVT